MGKIYRIKNPETGEYEHLVSKDYIDIELKRVIDALHIDLPAVLSDDEVIDLNITPDKMKASDLKQDATHRMVSDAQLELFKKKPTLHEIEDKLYDLKKFIEEKQNQNFVNLLNTPNAVPRLRRLATILQNDNTLESLFEVLDDTVTIEELKAHNDSNKHVTNVDRKSLNLLQDLISSGVFDKLKAKNEDIEVARAIDASSVCGRSLNNLRRMSDMYCVFTIGSGSCCTAEECDLWVGSKDLLGPRLGEINSSKPIVQFSIGDFDFGNYQFKWTPPCTHYSIRGYGFETRLHAFKVETQRISFKDLAFVNSSDVISTIDIQRGYVDHVMFDGYKILLDQEVTFSDCVFKNCMFKFASTAHAVIIKDSKFKSCEIPKFASQHVIIKDNFEI